MELMKGLFIEYNQDVGSIYSIRFPCVLIVPYEIPSAIMMAILGGPVFILLLKRRIQQN